MKISAKVGDQLLDVTIEPGQEGYVVEVEGKTLVVDVQKLEGDFYSILTDGRSYEVSVEPRGDGYQVRHGAAEKRVAFTDPGRQAREVAAVEGIERVVSMMPGKVVRVLVAQGDAVEAGQGLLVVEAMKMENEITAAKSGTVLALHVAPGQAVEGGALLAEIE